MLQYYQHTSLPMLALALQARVLTAGCCDDILVVNRRVLLEHKMKI